MAFELSVDGTALCLCDTAEEALLRARQVVRAHADSEPEIFPLATGLRLGPAASLDWREHTARTIGD